MIYFSNNVMHSELFNDERSFGTFGKKEQFNPNDFEAFYL